MKVAAMAIGITAGLAGSSFLTTGCGTSGSGESNTAEYIRELKSDELVGSVFIGAEDDSFALDLGDAICDSLKSGDGMIAVAMEMNSRFDWDMEVATTLVLKASMYYCPEVEADP